LTDEGEWRRRRKTVKTKLFALFVILGLAAVLLMKPAYAAIPGDINLDGKVDILDVTLATGQYGLTPAMPGYNSTIVGRADLAAPYDGVLNIYDLVTLVSHYTG
jgi:hypothetical protein